MKIVNREELDGWLFDRSAIQGHRCDGIKGTIQGIRPGDGDADLVNIAYVDTVTGEKFYVIYS